MTRTKRLETTMRKRTMSQEAILRRTRSGR
jgi:hypothetical protein